MNEEYSFKIAEGQRRPPRCKYIGLMATVENIDLSGILEPHAHV